MTGTQRRIETLRAHQVLDDYATEDERQSDLVELRALERQQAIVMDGQSVPLPEAAERIMYWAINEGPHRQSTFEEWLEAERARAWEAGYQQGHRLGRNLNPHAPKKVR
jgi:hypothetical protein